MRACCAAGWPSSPWAGGGKRRWPGRPGSPERRLTRLALALACLALLAQPGGLASGLVDLHFFNEHDGFAVGGLGLGPTEAEQRASRTVILVTSDGGETWQTRYTSASAGQWAWKIDFPSDHVGYVTTEGETPEGVVLKTEDGGATWRPVMVAPGASFEGLGFVTPRQGWVASFPTLHATTDGGASWTALQFGTRINRMRVLNDGLVYASGDRVYRWTR